MIVHDLYTFVHTEFLFVYASKKNKRKKLSIFLNFHWVITLFQKMDGRENVFIRLDEPERTSAVCFLEKFAFRDANFTRLATGTSLSPGNSIQLRW